MKPKLILVVEDDAAIREGIVSALQFEGYQTLEAGDGEQGLELALSAGYDLLLLDLVLPGKDGLQILEELRKAKPTLPVVILTARGDETDRVTGLKLGADDYVVKPFSVKELLARVEAVLRRSPERPIDIAAVTVPGGEADLALSEVRFEDGEKRTLSEKEVELLRYMACNAGRIVSRDELLSRVWGIEAGRIETRTIDMHVARLREKLRDDSSKPQIIRTVRGKGYIFDGPEESS
ncbi:MAG: response regulator transcription factor [Planctomycetota bacterium]|jgi:DNA-binding response OmpR family regulator